MGTKVKRMVKVGDEEVSESAWKKIREDFAKEVLENQLQRGETNSTCHNCQTFPRSNDKNYIKCSNCGRITCQRCKDFSCKCHKKSDERPLSTYMQVLLKVAPRKCKFSRFGCKVSQKEDEIDTHEVECQSHRVKCFLCFDEEMESSNILNHFEQNHEMEKSFVGDKTHQMPMGTWTGFYPGTESKIEAFNKTFYEVSTEDGSRIRRWIYLVGLPSEARKFNFQAVYQKEDGRKFTYDGPVYSVTESKEEIFRKKVFSLPLGTYKDTYETSKYFIKIFRLNNEA